MAEAMVTIAGGASGGLLNMGMEKLMGGGSGEGQGVGAQIEDQINMMNKKLTQNLNAALGYGQDYTNLAIQQQGVYTDKGVNALNNALNNATGITQNSLLQGFNQSQALQSPYALMGYNAADAYADSLGIARPKNGSASMAQMMNQAATAINPGLLQDLQLKAKAAGQDPFSSNSQMAAAPVSNVLTQQQILDNMTPQDLQLYNADPRAVRGAQNKAHQQALKQYVTNTLSQSQAAAAQQQAAYQKNTVDPYNAYQGAQQSLLGSLQGMSPEQLKTAMAYRNGAFNTPTRI